MTRRPAERNFHMRRLLRKQVKNHLYFTFVYFIWRIICPKCSFLCPDAVVSDPHVSVGFGFFHWLLLVVCGWANASNVVEILCVPLAHGTLWPPSHLGRHGAPYHQHIPWLLTVLLSFLFDFLIMLFFLKLGICNSFIVWKLMVFLLKGQRRKI